MVQRPDGSLVEVPPERCGISTHGTECDSTELRPSWDRCPQQDPADTRRPAGGG